MTKVVFKSWRPVGTRIYIRDFYLDHIFLAPEYLGEVNINYMGDRMFRAFAAGIKSMIYQPLYLSLKMANISEPTPELAMFKVDLFLSDFDFGKRCVIEKIFEFPQHNLE